LWAGFKIRVLQISDFPNSFRFEGFSNCNQILCDAAKVGGVHTRGQYCIQGAESRGGFEVSIHVGRCSDGSLVKFLVGHDCH
jgi:hypothetical protein